MRVRPITKLSKRLRKSSSQLANCSRRFTARNWQGALVVTTIAACVIIPGMQPQPQVNATALLDTIAKGESRGNYNAYYGNAGNTEIKFTEMTVGEVLAWQKEFVDKGSPSSAVGKYQFIQPTLEGLVKEMKVDRTAKFDAQLQDRLAKRLLERRGLNDYVKGKISREEFAHNLSKEWAALPTVLGDKPDQSYYAGDGLNHVQIAIDEIFNGISSIHP